MRHALFLILAAALARAGDACVSVDNLRVTAADISAAIPAFAALPPETMLGYAPTPGLTRWWRGAEVARLAARYTLAAGTLPDFCVVRPTQLYTPAEVAAALQAALPEGARLEVVDFCRMPMPKGRLAFQLRSLQRSSSPSAAAALLWRGQVVFDGARSAPFWATVRVSSARTGLYAAREIDQIRHGWLARGDRRRFYLSPRRRGQRGGGRISAGGGYRGTRGRHRV